MSVSRLRRLAGAGSLFALALAAGCSDGTPNAMAPSDNTRTGAQPLFVTVPVLWDFAAIIPGAVAGCNDWGTSELIPNAPYGSINATTGDGNTTITSKGLELPVGDTERGLGLALGGPCIGDEVGDGGDGFLYLDLNGVLPAGSTLTQIDLGSVQGTAEASTQEGWEIDASTTGLGGPYSPLSKGFGDGVNNVGDNITISGLSLPTAGLVLRFKKNLDAPGNATTDNDYVVKTVTTSFEEEVDEGCTFTQGYWKTHASGKKDAWPVASLEIGGIVYTKAELVAIMEAPTAGNGIMSLVQQLIAAKLNVLSGASDASIATAIADADQMIDDAGGKIVPPYTSPYLAPSVTSALNDELTDFNEGTTGPGHCE